MTTTITAPAQEDLHAFLGFHLPAAMTSRRSSSVILAPALP